MQMLGNNLSCNIRNSKPCSITHPPPATPPKPDFASPTDVHWIMNNGHRPPIKPYRSHFLDKAAQVRITFLNAIEQQSYALSMDAISSFAQSIASSTVGKTLRLPF